MHWLDGSISLDDNLISGRVSGGSNGENSDSKPSKASTKAKRRRHAHYKLNTRLDRKSSRGMIYENEELRLRTININAEVERGQSDIKRLRRENEQLRREIWTLRDECDRLNKRFKAKLVEYEHSGCSARGSGGSGGCTRRSCGGGCDGIHSHSNSDDSDSCDTCRGDDDHCSDDCCATGSCNQLPTKQSLVEDVPQTHTTEDNSQISAPSTATTAATSSEAPNLHNAFDHLSVVSEETLSNSEVQVSQNENLMVYTPEHSGSQITIPSMMGSLTPLTPIELVANQLNDLQAVVPPLSYFENILSQHMGSSIGNTPESATSSNTSRIVKHTNGWDYNLQSPFAQRKGQSSSSSSTQTLSSRSPSVVTQRYAAQSHPQLTTFLSAPPTPSVIVSNTDSPTESSPTNAPTIETVAITTMPTNTSAALNSPKHFFAPLKPRLKINTSLANKNLIAATVPTVPPTTIATTEHQNCDPPDIFVANGLASPYKRPSMPIATTAATTNPTPPPLPQRTSSSQVSPRHRQRNHEHHHHHVHHQHQQQQQLQQEQHEFIVPASDHIDVAADVELDGHAAATGNSAILINTNLMHLEPVTTKLPTTTTICIETSNTLLTKFNEPIYATAQKACYTLISAPAVTKPLMTATTNTTKTMAILSPKTETNIRADSHIQTDSVNLETILNDIETISEDILAIQLEKCKSRDNLIAATSRSRVNGATTKPDTPLQQDDKNKKPYRSEMNLTLTYDGINQTITAATANATATQSASANGNSSGRSTRSLEREHTDSPSPHIPDPMAPFPDNRTYIGFEQLNTAAAASASTTTSPNKPPSHVVATVGGNGTRPGTPIKPTPPTPPTRMFLPPLNIRCIGMARATAPNSSAQGLTDQQLSQLSAMSGLSPNKSHLYTAIANAAAKRAQFRAAPSHLTKSLDLGMEAGEGTGEDNESSKVDGAAEATQAAEVAKKKARRVSIVCGETSNPTTPEHTSSTAPIRSQAQNIYTVTAPTTTTYATATTTLTMSSPSTTTNPIAGSCSELPSVLTNPAMKNLKQPSYSTPNSPHSSRRRSNSNTMPTNNAEPIHSLAAAAASSQSQPITIVGGQYHHHQQNSNSTSNIPAAQQRKSSQDSTRGSELAAAAAAIVARSKCSRRHSDGTVASNVQRVSGISGGGGSNNHHHGHGHAHHHHHHQHNTSLISANPHHSHHSHQDSNQETGTSLSDHNSNSFASSRESSTSFSMRSQRRKISVSSHTGGKIPWCGCWGNGCL